MKKKIVAALISAIALSANAAEKFDEGYKNEASKKIGLGSYVLQLISLYEGKTATDKELEACAIRFSRFAPGGGDAYSQSRGFNSAMPLQPVMLAALKEAAKYSSASAACDKRMSNQTMEFSRNSYAPEDRVALGKDGRIFSDVKRQKVEEWAADGLMCSIALSIVSEQVESSLKQRPAFTVEEATERAAKIIAENLGAQNAQVRKRIGETVAVIPGDNAGRAVAAVVAKQENVVYFDMQQGTQQTGAKSAPLATVASVVADKELVGGVYAYATNTTPDGFVAAYDGQVFKVTKKGLPFFDGSTINGGQKTIPMAAQASYTASGSFEGSRTAELGNAGVCLVATNLIAEQLKPSLHAARDLPIANKAVAKKYLAKANIRKALDQASRELAGAEIVQDYSKGGVVWQQGSYGFMLDMAHQNLVVTKPNGAAVWFDKSHVSGMELAVSVSKSNGATSDYTVGNSIEAK